MKQGYIPKNITFYCQSKRLEVNVKDSNNIIKDIFNAFPVDPEKNTETAKHWCKSSGNSSLDQPIQFDYENTPIEKVKIVGWENRTYGIQYKAIVHDKFYVDVGAEVVMDIISNSSITNNVVGDKMIFVKQHATMKLVRFGGEVYNQFVTKENSTILYSKNLVPGNVYNSPSNGDVAFISNSPVIEMNIEGKWIPETRKNIYYSAFSQRTNFIMHKETFEKLLDGKFEISSYENRPEVCYLFSNSRNIYSMAVSNLPNKTSKIKFYHDSEIRKEMLNTILTNLDDVEATNEDILKCAVYCSLVYNITKLLEIEYESLSDKFKIVIDMFRGNGYAY